MCNTVKRLDQQLDQSIRLTQNKDEVVEILRMTEIIDGKAIAEAVEFAYYDTETIAFKELAKLSGRRVESIKRAYQAYKGELKIRFEVQAKLEANLKKIEAKQAKKLAQAKTKEAEKQAKDEAEKEKEIESEIAHETETKLKDLSDEAKRELAKGTTTMNGKTDHEAVKQAVEILEAIPPKATAKDIKGYRSEYLDDQLNDWNDERTVATDEKQAEKIYKQMEAEADKLTELVIKYNKLMGTKGISFISNTLNIEVS